MVTRRLQSWTESARHPLSTHFRKSVCSPACTYPLHSLNLLCLRLCEVLLDKCVFLLLGLSFFDTPFSLYLYLVFVYVCGGQRTAFRSLFSPSLGSQGGTQVLRLRGKHFYQMGLLEDATVSHLHPFELPDFLLSPRFPLLSPPPSF